MKLLSDYKGEEALDILADIIEPLCMILADAEIQELNKLMMAKKKKKDGKYVTKIDFIKPALKNHKDEVIYILARIEGVTPDEYRDSVNILTLPTQILSVVNDPTIKSLFHSQSQTSNTSIASSGSATANTEAGEN